MHYTLLTALLILGCAGCPKPTGGGLNAVRMTSVPFAFNGEDSGYRMAIILANYSHEVQPTFGPDGDAELEDGEIIEGGMPERRSIKQERVRFQGEFSFERGEVELRKSLYLTPTLAYYRAESSELKHIAFNNYGGLQDHPLDELWAAYLGPESRISDGALSFSVRNLNLSLTPR